MAIQNLTFGLPDGGAVALALDRVVAAGFTTRDKALIQAHVDELAAQGIPAPAHIPFLFPVMPTLVTNSAEIAVLGTDSTPELEVAMFRAGGVDYLTIASDQTDRVVEARDIVLSKNCCPKVVGAEAWPVAEVADHWDRLQFRSSCAGVLLQHGHLGMLIPHAEFLAFVAEHDGPRHEGRLILSGTIPTVAVPPKGEAVVELELYDPVRRRSIRHAYRITVLREFFG